MIKKGLLCLGLFFSLTLPWQGGLFADELSPASPTKVILQTKGGVLEVEEEVAVKTFNGKSTCEILLPEGAQNVRLKVLEHTILTWSQKPKVFKRLNSATVKRENLEKRLNDIDISLKLIKRRLETWNIVSNSYTYQDLLAIEKKKIELIPELLKEELSLNKERNRLIEQLKTLPELETQGSLVSITLTEVVSTPKVKVQYNYYLPKCGWSPHYAFAIEPEKNKSEVQVRFLADVWQNSGFDWQNSQIVLMTGSQGDRKPPSLANWVIAANPKLNSRDEDYVVMDEAPRAMSARMASRAPKSYAEPLADTSGIFATWELPSQTLKEGRLEMLIQERALKAPIIWLARPNRTSGEVFLTAKAKIPAGEVWPSGNAVYMVQGQTTGSGMFKTEGGEVVLHFGADPRVSLEVFQDTHKRGESGFLGRDKTWSWAWNYTLKNSHQQPIKVLLERPEPRAVDEDITINLEDKPKAQVDKQKHVLFWEVSLPAGGSETIHHGVTIKAPEKMSLYPVAP